MYLQDLEVYLRDYASQLECSEQYSMIKTYYRFVLLQLIIHFHSRSKPPQSCYQKLSIVKCTWVAIYITITYPTRKINSSKCMIGGPKIV